MFWSLFLIYLATACVAGATGVIFKPGEWYAGLKKPSFTPPDWAFPVVWTTLYVLMALAAARVAVEGGHSLALALWALQIALNTLWTPVFFGARNMRGGMIVLAALWVAVAATMVAFLGADLIAGLLLVPYLVWVSLAAALNWSLLRLN